MMTNRFANLSRYAPVVTRIGMCLVFLCFSFNQFSNSSAWVSYVPDSVSSLFGGNAVLLVMLNAWFELVMGLTLIVGFQTRIASALLALHLFSITVLIGWSPTGIRDFGLMIATASIFFAGPDVWSIDSHSSSKKFIAASEPLTKTIPNI